MGSRWLQNYHVATGGPGKPWAADSYKITVYLQADLVNLGQCIVTKLPCINFMTWGTMFRV